MAILEVFILEELQVQFSQVFILKMVRGELGCDGRGGVERGGDGTIARDWARAARRSVQNKYTIITLMSIEIVVPFERDEIGAWGRPSQRVKMRKSRWRKAAPPFRKKRETMGRPKSSEAKAEPPAWRR